MFAHLVPPMMALYLKGDFAFFVVVGFMKFNFAQKLHKTYGKRFVKQ